MQFYRITTPKKPHQWYNKKTGAVLVTLPGRDTPKARFGMLSQYTPQTILRFWSMVDRADDPNVCWVWTRSGFISGYGQFKVKERNLRAHRVAWEVTHGTIPDGLSVLHRCDNRRCCNPAHLWLGTHRQNMADMQRKGRAASGDKNGSRLHPDRLLRGDAHPARSIAGWSQGERNGEARLTALQVQDIRAQYAAGGASFQEIGNAYRVSKQTIYRIVHRKNWRHVP